MTRPSADWTAPGVCLVLVWSILSGAALSATPTAPAGRTPEQDRAALVALFTKRFPAVGIDDWGQGSAAFTPGTATAPLGGTHATNTADLLAIGKKRWERKFANGKSLAQCFPNAGRRAAAAYPLWDAKAHEIVTLEAAINRCLSLHGEMPLPADDPLTLPAVAGYLRSLSVGQKLSVRVTPDALPAYRDGRRLFSMRIGSRDLACASCHVLQAGETVDGAVLSPAVGQVLAWPRVERGGALRTLHQQFQHCMARAGAEPYPVDAPEFRALEFFLAALSHQLTIRPMIPTQ